MTPTSKPTQAEVDKELDKAKEALTNLTLMAVSEIYGSPLALQNNLLAERVERYWAVALKRAIPNSAKDNS